MNFIYSYCLQTIMKPHSSSFHHHAPEKWKVSKTLYPGITAKTFEKKKHSWRPGNCTLAQVDGKKTLGMWLSSTARKRYVFILQVYLGKEDGHVEHHSAWRVAKRYSFLSLQTSSLACIWTTVLVILTITWAGEETCASMWHNQRQPSSIPSVYLIFNIPTAQHHSTGGVQQPIPCLSKRQLTDSNTGYF